MNSTLSVQLYCQETECRNQWLRWKSRGTNRRSCPPDAHRYIITFVMRVRVGCSGYVLWSLATAATGLMRGFTMLLAMRLILGIGESVMVPACSKIFSFHLPEHCRGFAKGVPSRGSAVRAGHFGCRLLDRKVRLATRVHRNWSDQSGVASCLDQMDATRRSYESPSHCLPWLCRYCAAEVILGCLRRPLFYRLFALFHVDLASVLSRARTPPVHAIHDPDRKCVLRD
jgi:hypothetical protein